MKLLGIRPVVSFYVVFLVVCAAGAVGHESGLEAERNLPGWVEWVKPVVEGENEGGVAFFPAHFSAGEPISVRDPESFWVRFVSADRPDEERVVRAGEAQTAPPGRWRFWIEGDWEISPGSNLAIFPRQRRTQFLQARYLPAEPGGRVLGPEEPADLELWAVHAELQGVDEPFGQIARRVRLAEVDDGLLMPSGQTLAGLWNPSDQEFVAVSRPFGVDAGEHVRAPLVSPEEGQAFLVVEVPHALRVSGAAGDGVELQAQQGEKTHAPEEWVVTPEASYALWFDLAPGPVKVIGGGQQTYLPSSELVLKDAAVGHLAQALLPRPILDVSWVMPQELRTGPLSLSVFRTEGAELLAEAELAPQQSRHRFHLVHDEVTVQLESDLGTYRRVVDLTDETEASVLLEPEVIHLTGEVRFGGEPVVARVRLHTTDGHRVEVESDEDGWFEALALRPVYWGAVFLSSDETSQPWMQSWMPPLSEDRHLEIDIPDVEITVSVVDRSSGLPIPDARVSVKAHFRPWDAEEESKEDESGLKRAMGRSYTTDEEGVAELVSARPGRLEIWARADGYHPSGDPVDLPIPDPPVDREIVVALERLGPGDVIRFLLPDGRPAGGAELLVISDSAGAASGISLRADPEGEAEIPADGGVTLLLVRHPDAASGVVAWPTPNGGDKVWTLEPAVSTPLRIQVVEPGGGEPALRAIPILWIDGVALNGALLRWLFDARPFIGPRGYWSASQLPPRPIRLLVTDPSSQEEFQAYRNLATEIAYPWPSVVELEIIR